MGEYQMRIKIIAIFAFVVCNAALADAAADAGAKLYEYFATFNDKDVHKVAHTIYSTPVHIGGGSGHRVLADPDTAVENLTNLYEQIEAQGWVESKISDLVICLASESLALVDARYSRIDNEGNAIPPEIRTTLYVLQKIDGDWRIVAFYGHDNDKRPACGQG
jgi:hypothetical protein